MSIDNVNEECSTCKFWGYNDANPDGNGTCHRFPPAPSSLWPVRLLLRNRATQVGHEPDEDDPVTYTHPATMESDWCGEWQVSQDSIKERGTAR